MRGPWLDYSVDYYTSIVIYGLSAVALILWARRIMSACRKPDQGDNENSDDAAAAATEKADDECAAILASVEGGDVPERNAGVELNAAGEPELQETKSDLKMNNGEGVNNQHENDEKQQHPMVRKYLSKRRPYLDVVKVALTVAVVIAHCSEVTVSPVKSMIAPGIASYMNWMFLLILSIAPWAFCALMNMFFFISGIFTPRSFKNKTVEAFIFDKLKRLMLPTLILWFGLNPLNRYLTSLATNNDFVYGPTTGVSWFLMRLALLNLAYAFVMASSAGSGDKAIGSWFGHFLRFDTTLYFWIMAAGVITGIVVWASAGTEYLEITPFPGSAFTSYNCFFVLGCYTGSHGWLEYFENCVAWKSDDQDGENKMDHDAEELYPDWKQKNTTAQARNLIICSYYAFPILYVLGTAMFVYLFLVNDQNLFWPFIESIAYNVFMSLLALASAIVIIDYTCRKVQNINLLVLMMMQAAYAVFLIHQTVLTSVMILWVYILRSGFGIDIEFQLGPENNASDTELGGGVIFLGWLFVNVLTQLIVWPLAFFVRKLPILNQMI